MTVHVKPNAETAPVDTVAVGDTVDLFDLNAGWGWVRTTKGVGYVRADGIVPA